MLTTEVIKKIAYTTVIESFEEILEKIPSERASYIADVADSIRKRSEDFYEYIMRYGVLSTLSFYLSKASNDKTYDKLLQYLRGDRRDGSLKLSSAEAGYAAYVYTLFKYLGALAKRSDIPEVCRLANKILPCTPDNSYEFIRFLVRVVELEPFEMALLRIVLREFAEAAKSISLIEAAKYQR